MTDSSYEREKKERRRLRARQRHLKARFLHDMRALPTNVDLWKQFSKDFQEALTEDARIDPHWIEPGRYPIALFNLFTALGFQVHSGSMPRVSGVQPDYRTPFLAYSPSRAILLDDRPSSVFVDVADVQPVCPVPILGLAYNSILSAKISAVKWNYPARSLQEGRRMARALALGHFTLSYQDLAKAVSLHPVSDRSKLRRLAKNLGIESFLNPPVDALPVYGQFSSSNFGAAYSVDNFLVETQKTQATGAEVTIGDITQARPEEVIRNPEYYFRELERAKLLDLRSSGIEATQEGWAYLRSRVLPFPLGQLLYHATMAARMEVQQAARSAFAEALRSGNADVDFGPTPLMVSVEEIENLQNVHLVSPLSVRNSVPVDWPEAEIKKLICGLLGTWEQDDWGGEQNDIITSHLIVGGRRRLAAFLLKGPSVRSPLTIAKCGKNGDQIQRLFQSPADVFVVQFNGEIHERVIEEARQKTKGLRAQGARDAVFCIIDGIDTARLIAAYGENAKH